MPLARSFVVDSPNTVCDAEYIQSQYTCVRQGKKRAAQAGNSGATY